MRKKIIGLVLLICAMAAVGGIYLLTGGSGDGREGNREDKAKDSGIRLCGGREDRVPGR